MPKVTVLMPVFNSETYLDIAIESILNQSFEDFEFLIVDDASTDSTPLLLQKWQGKDKRIKIVTAKSNKGLGYWLHESVKLAKGAYIARMDGDDIAHPDRLQVQTDFLDANTDITLVGTWATDINLAGEKVSTREYPIDHDAIANIIWTSPLIHPTVMFRGEKIQKVGGYDPALRRRQDYDLWFRCLAAGHRFHNIPEHLLEYRTDFTEYNKKNGIRVAWEQCKIGWRGARLVKLPLKSYLGISFPLVKAISPPIVRKVLLKIAKSVDPRR